MEMIGTIVTWIMMVCCVIGGVAYAIDETSDLGSAFMEGLHVMANMFIPICGLMAAVPFVSDFIVQVIGPVFGLIGADPVVASAFVFPPDCGSFALATEIGQTPDLFPLVIATGFMCASTIAFNIPIGLQMIDRRDHKFLALGTLSGFLAVPFGILVTCLIVAFTHPSIATVFASGAANDYVVNLTIGMIALNMIPLVIICLLMAVGLKLAPEAMMKGFAIFGKVLTAALTGVVVVVIVEHYTGFFSMVFGGWGFDPILADAENTTRAIEILGTIAMMLTGALPMVTLIQKYLGKPLSKLGRLAGLEEEGSVGLVACLPNGLAVFPFIKNMRPEDKVVIFAFLPCAGYCLGDFLAFNVNFQPNLLIPILVGQVVGGIIGIVIARFLAVPEVKKMRAAGEIEEAAEAAVA